MKIRLSDQSLRVRLSADDIELFEKQGSIRYALVIGKQALRIRLQLVRELFEISAALAENEITVNLKETALKELKNERSISERQKQDGGELSILIEKDGPCKH